MNYFILYILGQLLIDNGHTSFGPAVERIAVVLAIIHVAMFLSALAAKRVR